MEYKKLRIGRNMTVGEWLERTIYDLKFPTRMKPSSTWQCYQCLFNKLKAEGNIFDLPVCKVNDRTFRQLIRHIQNKSNFMGTMKVFTALINRARKQRLTKYVADFPYANYQPKRKQSNTARIVALGGNVRSLSTSQWNAFLNLDLDRIRIANGPHMAYWKEVYRDFCILLYEMKSRPIDILTLHRDNIVFHEETGRWLCTYVPAKKKNRGKEAIQFLSPKAVEIIERYRRKSVNGYVLPFAINDRRWNLDNPFQYHLHHKLATNQLSLINRFLHLVGDKLEIPFPFTLYSIRRTAITHALMENRIPIHILAEIAGTSVRMIERHYTNFLHTLAAY